MNITNWFTGVVEDINDPLQSGRVRVRCFTYHTDSREDIPTEDLPWSTCIIPVTSSGLGGVGQVAVGLMPGSWVFGFFRDSLELQDPVVVGTFLSNTSSLPPEDRLSGFADPLGAYPNTIRNDIHAGATTYGFASSEGTSSQISLVSAYNSSYVGAGSDPSTLLKPSPEIKLNGSAGTILSIAQGQAGVIETSKNQGAGIAKYWTSVDYKSGYANSDEWCAAFVCWCIQQSGIMSEKDRPKTAAAFGFEGWAKSKPSIASLTLRPRNVKAGDIVIFSWSHVGFAVTDSDPAGKFRTVEGNTTLPGKPHGVHEKNRVISSLQSIVTIGSPPTTTTNV